MKGVILAVVLVAALGVAGLVGGRLLAPSGGEGSALTVEKRLTCPQCAGTRLDVCDQQICADMRADIESRLRAGESPASIVSSYRRLYGPRVVADSGDLNLAAIVPWLAIALALGLMTLAASRLWRTEGDARLAPGEARG